MGKKSSQYEPYPPCNANCHNGKCDLNPEHTIWFPAFRRYVNEHMTTNDRRKQFEDMKKKPAFKGWLKHQQRIGLECYYCGENLEGKNYHVDHYIPLKLKGKNSVNNFRISCPHCNLTKHAKHPDTFFPDKRLSIQ